ncbi:MAG: type II toxin-antitoxin system death-on-curing family toxin [Desulfarculaceae bacterium]|jgi:death-on-curing protein
MPLEDDQEIHFLTLEEVVQIHQDQVEKIGGQGGIRHEGRLRACISLPANKMGGSYAHRDLFEMAAAYLFHIADQKPFLEANDRVAAMSALYFLFLHHIELSADSADFANIVSNASRGKASKMQIADFLRKKSILVD